MDHSVERALRTVLTNVKSHVGGIETILDLAYGIDGQSQPPMPTNTLAPGMEHLLRGLPLIPGQGSPPKDQPSREPEVKIRHKRKSGNSFSGKIEASVPEILEKGGGMHFKQIIDALIQKGIFEEKTPKICNAVSTALSKMKEKGLVDRVTQGAEIGRWFVPKKNENSGEKKSIVPGSIAGL
jgi:hypothetical protein